MSTMKNTVAVSVSEVTQAMAFLDLAIQDKRWDGIRHNWWNLKGYLDSRGARVKPVERSPLPMCTVVSLSLRTLIAAFERAPKPLLTHWAIIRKVIEGASTPLPTRAVVNSILGYPDEMNAILRSRGVAAPQEGR